jgi:thioredoxin reductase
MDETDATDERCAVAVVGGGVAGLSAALFTARADLDTVVFDAGDSILRRNAHLENFPGFPAGVDARRLLSATREQVVAAGADHRTATVTAVRSRSAATDGGHPERAEGTDAEAEAGGPAPRFVVETDAGDRVHAAYVVAATKNTVDYLDVDGVGVLDRGKTFLDTDEGGRTGVDGLYAAGRLAEKPHQAVVCAGHGAEVGVALLEDDPRPFYHDWVTPAGYFTDRDRPLPPGCEEIDDAERRRRDDRARAVMRERLAAPSSEPPRTHPSLREDDGD